MVINEHLREMGILNYFADVVLLRTIAGVK